MIIFTPNTVIKSTEINSNFAELKDGTGIDNGAITMPKISNPYMFRAYRSGAWNLGSNAEAIVVLDAITSDPNNNFDTSTGKYTVPIDGYYFFTCQMNGDTKSGSGIYTSIMRNGATVARGDGGVPVGYTGTFPTSCNAQCLLYCSAGDLIHMISYGGASHAGNTGATITYLQGFLVNAV